MHFVKPIDMPKVHLPDPKFNIPSDIDILIGAQLYESLRTGRNIKYGNLYLTRTVFGYAVSGSVTGQNDPFPIENHIQASDDSLQKFWDLEEIPNSNQVRWAKEDYDRALR